MGNVKKIMIVGGAGYVGSHANKLLSNRGYDTVVFDNLSTGHKELVKWGDYFYGDLRSSADIRKCLKEHNVSDVMHFAACALVGESMSDPAKYYDNNVVNMLNLLNEMRVAGIRNIVFSSSAAVYGVPTEVPIPEEHRKDPINPYGRTKSVMEDIMKDYRAAYGLEAVNLRYFNAAGADPEGEIGEMHFPETHAIPLALQAAAGFTGPFSVLGADYDTPDGTCVRDYVHVADLASAHLLALELLRGKKSGATVNLGNGRGFSVREIVDMARKVTGRRFNVVEAARRPGDPPTLVASCGKAMELLGWKPEHSDLEEIVGTAWRWMLRRFPAGVAVP